MTSKKDHTENQYVHLKKLCIKYISRVGRGFLTRIRDRRNVEGAVGAARGWGGEH